MQRQNIEHLTQTIDQKNESSFSNLSVFDSKRPTFTKTLNHIFLIADNANAMRRENKLNQIILAA